MGTYETRNGMERNQLGRALVKIAVPKFTSLFSIVLPYLMVFYTKHCSNFYLFAKRVICYLKLTAMLLLTPCCKLTSPLLGIKISTEGK